MYADDIGCSEQGADVLRILKMIQKQQQWRLATCRGESQHLVKLDVWIRTSFERDALVVDAAGHLVQNTAVAVGYLDLRGVGQGLQFQDRPTLLHPLGNQQTPEMTTPCAESLAHGVSAVD